jgi:hypothetical protein
MQLPKVGPSELLWVRVVGSACNEYCTSSSSFAIQYLSKVCPACQNACYLSYAFDDAQEQCLLGLLCVPCRSEAQYLV